MPDESCRSCGGILIKCSLCAQCKKLTQYMCQKCGLKTEEQFHHDCFYTIESIQMISPRMILANIYE